MANLNKIRIIKDGMTRDYEVSGSEGTPSETELPIDYNTVYDTEEHQVGWYAVTGGYKPLYRIQESFTTGTAYTYTVLTPAVNNIEKIVSILPQSYVLESNGNYYPANVVRINSKTEINGEYANWFRINADPVGIASIVGDIMAEQTCVLFIEYIKTTDTVVAEIPKQTIPAITQKQTDIYSTNEQVIGQWIDGKPLYRRCVSVGNLSAGQNSVGKLTSWNIDRIKSINGSFKFSDSNNQAYFPHCLATDNGDYAVVGFYDSTSTDLYIWVGNTRGSVQDVVAIVEYTKTTDVIGGGE